jgi:uncharacterized membrane protein (DUF485 family)
MAGLLVSLLAGMAWGQDDIFWLACAVLPPVLWMLSSSRLSGAFLMLTYYLTASRGLPGGAVVFFGEAAPLWWGVLLWLGAAFCSTLPWLIFWKSCPRRRALWFPIVIFLSVVPPLGFVAWTSPLLSASVLFPGLGFVGLIALTVAWMAIGLRARVIGASIVLLSIFSILTAPVVVAPGWIGANTHYGRLSSSAEEEDGVATFGRLRDIRRIAAALPVDSVVVLPETVLGSLDATMLNALDDISRPLARRPAGMLIGGEFPTGIRGRYVNAVVGIGSLQGIVARQRVPVPIAMWQPWTNSGAVANWRGSGISNILSHRAAILICYEQLIMWPALLSAAASPSIFVGVANDWWARETSIPLVQAQSLAAIGRLFGLPVISAVNL